MDAATTTAPAADLHPFARAGYPGPWTYLGPLEKTYQACQGAPVQAAGSCDVCGTCFRYGAMFRASTGVEFVTGCDCAVKSLREHDPELAALAKAAKAEILKANRAAARSEARAAAKAERAAKEAEREAREAEEVNVWAAELDWAALEAVAHRKSWAAVKGLSGADEVRYWLHERGNFRVAGAVASEIMADIATGEAKPRIVPPTVAGGHVGKIKERIEIRGRVVFATRFPNDFGGYMAFTNIVKIVTEDGRMVGYKGSSADAFFEGSEENEGSALLGRKVAIKATVKAHDVDKYSEGKEITWVQRPTALVRK